MSWSLMLATALDCFVLIILVITLTTTYYKRKYSGEDE